MESFTVHYVDLLAISKSILYNRYTPVDMVPMFRLIQSAEDIQTDTGGPLDELMKGVLRHAFPGTLALYLWCTLVWGWGLGGKGRGLLQRRGEALLKMEGRGLLERRK
jgi:hypothetical protein